MSTAQSADMLWYLLALVLVGSALLSRRFSLRGALGMGLGWVAIFAVILFLYSQRERFGQFTRETGEKIPVLTDQRIEGHMLRISMAPDGHFWADGKINGMNARFLIDSGATITALSENVAQQAGLNIDSDGPGVMMKTANGTIVARRSSVAGLTVGPIQASDLPVVVSDSFDGVNVLGMNFLSRLKSWRVERNEMVLEP
ncbi:MAG: TIGR02281 family clan AA aspartic protease [Sphingobium sp.]